MGHQSQSQLEILADHSLIKGAYGTQNQRPCDVKINGVSSDATGKNFIHKDEQLTVAR